MTKIIRGLVILILLNIIGLAEEIKLYKNYTFNMSKSNINKIKGIYDCSKEVGENTLCLDNQTFAGLETLTMFKFINNKLSQILLGFEYNTENYLKLFGVVNNKFAFLAMQSNKGRLDLIELYKKEPKNAISKIGLFESTSLAEGNLTYIFLDKNNTNKLIKRVSNVTELVLKSENNLREVDLMITSDNSEQFILISFNTPKMAIKMTQNSLKNIETEDF